MRLGVAIDLTPGLDGKIWPRLQVINGVTAFILTVPTDAFESLLNQLYTEGMKAVKAAKEENSPIKVARDIPGPMKQKRHG